MPANLGNPASHSVKPSRTWVGITVGLIGGSGLTAIGVVLFFALSAGGETDSTRNDVAQGQGVQAPAPVEDPSIVPDPGSGRLEIYQSTPPNSTASASEFSDQSLVQAKIDPDVANQSAAALFKAARAAIKRGSQDGGFDAARYAMRILSTSGIEKDRELIETFEHAGHRFEVYVHMGPDDVRKPKHGVFKLLTCEITANGETKPAWIFEYEVEFENGSSKTGKLYQTKAGGERSSRFHSTLRGNRHDYENTRRSIVQEFDRSLRNQ